MCVSLLFYMQQLIIIKLQAFINFLYKECMFYLLLWQDDDDDDNEEQERELDRHWVS